MKHVYYESSTDKFLHTQIRENIIEWETPSHFHNSIELQYITEGEYDFVINGTAYKATVDDIVFVPHYHIHSDKRNPHTHTIFILPCQNALVHYSDLFGKKTLPFLMQNKKFNKETIYPLLIYFLSRPNQHANDIAMRGMFDVLFANLIGEYKLENNVQTSNSYLVEVLRYIDTHYKEDLTLDDISYRFGYSTFYFSKLFKRLTSMTFSEYRTLIRVQKVIKALNESKENNLTAVALSCGFNSLSAFYRAFHRVHNIPPGQYKNLHEWIYWQ
jgi:AraC-like DNA-binding protein